jgi:uncharacterized protein (TIGR02466 family)
LKANFAAAIYHAMSDKKIEVHHLFSAPLLQLQVAGAQALNKELRQVILRKRELVPSERMSNAGGWQSPKDLQHSDDPHVRELLKRIDLAVYIIMGECLGEETAHSLTRWGLKVWANVNESGDYNTIHNHAGGVWSGVYYVDHGTSDPAHPYGGFLSFKSPTMAALATNNLQVPEPVRRLFPHEYLIQPQSGLMLVFPSWLEHQVYPYFGTEPRISISWDVVFGQ